MQATNSYNAIKEKRKPIVRCGCGVILPSLKSPRCRPCQDEHRNDMAKLRAKKKREEKRKLALDSRSKMCI